MSDGRIPVTLLSGDHRRNQLVFIGRDLDEHALRAGVSACLETPCTTG